MYIYTYIYIYTRIRSSSPLRPSGPFGSVETVSAETRRWKPPLKFVK